LGITLVRIESDTAGFGKNNKAMFWIGPRSEVYYISIHIAFAAKSRIQVDEFYKKVLASGGKDNRGMPNTLYSNLASGTQTGGRSEGLCI